MLSLIVMVCDTDDELLQASVNVHVRVTTNEFAHEPCVTTSTPSAVIVPEQLSVAVNETLAGTSAAQEAVTAAGAAGATGLVVSCTLNVAEVVEAFPQASVAVKITVTAAEQSLLSALKLLVHVTAEQASVAAAPPWLFNQSLSAVVLPDPSHSTTMFEAWVLITGAVTSWTLMVCVAVDELPQASVAVHVRVIEYEPAHSPCVVASAKVSVIALPQASVAVAVANCGVAGQLIVETAGNSAITGAVVSSTLMVCVAVDALPQASVAVHVLVTEYEPAHWPFVVTSVNVNVIALPQASVAVACANDGVAGQEIVDGSGNAAITGAVVS